MTDRHIGYVVTLESSIREDDAAATIAAIKMVKGVISVTPVLGSIATEMAEQKARHAIYLRLWAALRADES